MRYIIFLLLLTLSCQEDKVLKNVCADPIGAQNRTVSNNSLFCSQPKYNGCFVAQFSDSAQIFRAVDYNKIFPGTIIAMIADVGVVNCLGEITTKPTGSFYYGVYVLPKHGYVIKLPDNTYGRLFVDSQLSTGVGAKFNVTWQYSF